MSNNMHKNQKGMASLVIAILIIIILSTLVTGFLQIIRREGRRSLDRQLSSQAFYAAESAVNDATKAINDQNFQGNKTTCAPFPAGGGPAALSGNSNKLTADGSVSYTCLLIDQQPGSVVFKSIRTDHATSFPVQAGDGSPITSVTLTWRDTASGYDNFRPAAAKDFTTDSNWNSTGILRVDVVPADNLDRDSLITGMRSYFLYPNTHSGARPGVVSYSTQSGEIVNGQCAGVGDAANCSVIINGLSGNYSYVRVIALYRPVSLTVTAASGATPVTDLKNAQTQVDATGKAADVIRRIQVRLPRQDVDLPDYTLSSMDSLCKKFLVLPDGVFSDGGSDASCNISQ